MSRPPAPATRVLVVDDERNICFLLEVPLRQQGFEVQVAGTGREALELVARQAPDIRLLDGVKLGIVADGLAEITEGLAAVAEVRLPG
jgi:DNA-binding response OmpR family regulator